eukprot:scaffold16111_cov152-Skeletonema_dohrnii-CCMP3373.AAC.9
MSDVSAFPGLFAAPPPPLLSAEIIEERGRLGGRQALSSRYFRRGARLSPIPHYRRDQSLKRHF